MGIFNSAMALGMPVGTAIGGAIASFTGVQLFDVVDGILMLAVGVTALLSAALRSLDKGSDGREQLHVAYDTGA